jgi:hypothetical protein
MLVILLGLVSMRITTTFGLTKDRLGRGRKKDYRMPKKGFEPMLYRYE